VQPAFAQREGGQVLRETLAGLLRPVVEGLGYECWEIEYSPGRGHGLVRVYIDAAAGITVEDCERVSHAVSEALDAADPVPGQYTLEVSSPGLERPLRTAAQFARFAGEQVFVEMTQAVDARRRFKGRLVATAGGVIEVEVDGRRHMLPLSGIRKAHLAPDI
jgi:ribosome maturation factor RimP